jgi:hypothetical protein
MSGAGTMDEIDPRTGRGGGDGNTAIELNSQGEQMGKKINVVSGAA